MGLQAGPQLVFCFDTNQDFDCPVILVHHYKQRMLNFLNQPELGNLLKTVFTFYTKGMLGLASRSLFPKGCLQITVEDVC